MLKKVLLTGTALAVMAQNAMAAVDYSEVGGFTGSFDLTPYYTAIGIIVTAISVIAAVGLALRQFKKVS